MTNDAGASEFAVYLAPGTAPLAPQEIGMITLQTAALLGCDAREIVPVPIELDNVGEIEEEFSQIPQSEQSREPYLALLTLLRNGAHAIGQRCCLLVYDLRAPFPALDYLKGLAEITRLPVFLGVCHQPLAGQAHRQILVRKLR